MSFLKIGGLSPLNCLLFLFIAADRTVDRIATSALAGLGTCIAHVVPADHTAQVVGRTHKDGQHYD